MCTAKGAWGHAEQHAARVLRPAWLCSCEDLLEGAEPDAEGPSRDLPLRAAVLPQQLAHIKKCLLGR